MTRLFSDLLVTTAALTASSDALNFNPPPQQRNFPTRFETAEECIQTICSQEYYDAVFRTTNVDAEDIEYSPDPTNTYHATAGSPQQIKYRRRPTLAGFPIPIPKLNFCETWCKVRAEDAITHDKLSVHVQTDMMCFNVDMSFSESSDGVTVTLDGTWESGTGIIAPFFGSIVDQMQDTMGTILGEN
jgi:hypothetical protein